MDKITVNKQIVLLRKEVERAKVRVINKLTRDVKVLRVAKSWHTDEIKEKNAKKVERLITELKLTKKAQKDEVSKLALTSTKKDLDSLRADPDVPLERKSVARLASQPQFAARVEKFRSQYPAWETTLAPIVDSLGVKVKHRKRHRGPAADAERDGSTVAECGHVVDKTVPRTLSPHSNTVDANQDEAGATPSSRKKKKTMKTKEIVTTVGGVWQVEDTVASMSEQNGEVSSLPCSESLENYKVNLHKNKKESLGTNLCKATKLTAKNNKLVNKKSTSENNSKTTKVMRFSELLNAEKQLVKTKVNNVEEKPTLSEPKAVDSFFVSEDGETEYMSIAPAKEPEEKRDENQLHKYAKLREKYLNEFGRIPNRRELRLHERQKFSSTFTSLTRDQPAPHRKQFQSSRPREDFAAPKSQSLAAKPSRPIHSKASEVEGPVHPSWEAKRKAQEMLATTFQGKKIKFDD